MAEDEEIEFLLVLENMVNRERPMHRKYYKFVNAFDMPEKQFVKQFRLNKNLVRNLIDLVRPFVVDASRLSALRVESKVFMALNFFATGSYQLPVGTNYNISASQPSVSRSIHEIVDALNRPEIFDAFVRFPRNLQELNQVRQQFFDKYGMPGVIGCVDGSHVAIVPPKVNVAPENIYVNRKHYHSINMQLICDASLKIISVNGRFPGSCNDRYIWQNSNVEPILREIYNRGNEGYFLLGDSGYMLRPWLLIPLENPVTEAEERYNQEQRRIRSSVERCIGLFKMRFRCLLKDRVMHYSPLVAAKIINACAVLHNMCIEANIEIINENEELDFGIFEDIPPNDLHEVRNPFLQAGRRMQRRIINIYEVQHI